MGKASARFWLAGALLTLGAALVPGIVWLSSEEPGQQRQLLPDGSSVELMGWTFGNSHVFRTGPHWQTLLWPLAPPLIQERLSSVSEMQRQNSPPGSLVLWMWHRPENIASWPDYVEACNERGAALLTDSVAGYSQRGSGHRTLLPWAIDVFPRRGKFITVRPFLGLDLQRHVSFAEFRIPNPDPGPHPVWSAPPLPVTQRQDGLDFSLTRFTINTGRPSRKRRYEQEFPWTRVDFRIQQAGRLTTNWYPATVELTDATGNHWEPRFGYKTPPDGDPAFEFPGALDPGETYRLRVKFTNRRVSEARDQWKLPPISVPPVHASRPLRFVTTRNQIRIQALEALGPWARVPNRISPEPLSYIRLLTSPDARSKPQVELVRATDQRGRDLLVNSASWAEGRDGSSYFAVDAKSRVKTLHLTFGVHRSYDVEFLARPSNAQD